MLLHHGLIGLEARLCLEGPPQAGQAVDPAVPMDLDQVADDLGEVVMVVILGTVEDGMLAVVHRHDIAVRLEETRLDRRDRLRPHRAVVLDVEEPVESRCADQLVDALCAAALRL